MSVGDGLGLPIIDTLGEEEDLFGDVRTVLMTGAAGHLGRKLRTGWGNRYDLILIDVVPDPDEPDLIVADLADWDESWTSFFDEADAVVHLAANADEFASWPDLIRPNLDALNNVFLAAAQAGVDRFVFASSNHVMGGYRTPGVTGPISAGMPPRPGNPYGATKLVGERLGQAVATAFGMTVVALRIGWVQPGENRAETLDAARGDCSIWLSNRDLVTLFTRALEAELDEGAFVVVNGLSRNQGSRWTLTEAAEQIGYVPEDSSGESA